MLLATVARAQELSDQPLNWILDELGLTRSVYYDWLEKTRGTELLLATNREEVFITPEFPSTCGR